jgi:hypothetical protein
MTTHLQNDPNSALAKELHGARWSTEAQLMAFALDALHLGNWQRAGKRTAPKPKPIPRPWEKPKTTSLGSKPIPISQFDSWWESHKPKRR